MLHHHGHSANGVALAHVGGGLTDVRHRLVRDGGLQPGQHGVSVKVVVGDEALQGVHGMTFRDEERPVNDISLASGTGCGERGDESAGNIPALAQEIILVDAGARP